MGGFRKGGAANEAKAYYRMKYGGRIPELHLLLWAALYEFDAGFGMTAHALSIAIGVDDGSITNRPCEMLNEYRGKKGVIKKGKGWIRIVGSGPERQGNGRLSADRTWYSLEPVQPLGAPDLGLYRLLKRINQQARQEALSRALEMEAAAQPGWRPYK